MIHHKNQAAKIRWSMNRLAEETGFDRRTVKKALSDAEPMSDGGYRMRDFIDGLLDLNGGKSSALERERIRKTKLESDILEVDRARVRNEVIEVETVFRVWENIATGIKRTILTSPLPNEQKDCILRELQAVCIKDYVEQREFDQGTPAEAC